MTSCAEDTAVYQLNHSSRLTIASSSQLYWSDNLQSCYLLQGLLSFIVYSPTHPFPPTTPSYPLPPSPLPPPSHTPSPSYSLPPPALLPPLPLPSRGLLVVLYFPLPPSSSCTHFSRYLREEPLEVQLWTSVVSKNDLPHPQTSDKLQGCAYIPLQELASQCKDTLIIR